MPYTLDRPTLKHLGKISIMDSENQSHPATTISSDSFQKILEDPSFLQSLHVAGILSLYREKSIPRHGPFAARTLDLLHQKKRWLETRWHLRHKGRYLPLKDESWLKNNGWRSNREITLEIAALLGNTLMAEVFSLFLLLKCDQAGLVHLCQDSESLSIPFLRLPGMRQILQMPEADMFLHQSGLSVLFWQIKTSPSAQAFLLAQTF